MSWSSPPTAVTGAVITAAFWNTGGRDNLNNLDQRTTAIGNVIATSQTTAVTAGYTDLLTAGPGVSVTVGTSAKLLVAIGAAISNSGANLSYMAYAVSLVGTYVAADARSIAHSGTDVLRTGQVFVDSSGILGAGISNSLKAMYKVAAGTGTWSDRIIGAVPLGA